MNAIRTSIFMATCAFLAAILVAGCGARTADAVNISNARASATPPGATMGAAYMEIVSAGADTLTGASTPVADKVEMHTSREDGGMSRMRPLHEVQLAADEAFAFQPGGAHFMLVGLHAPLRAGTKIPLTLHFTKAGDILVEVPVAAPGAASTAH